MKTFRILLKIAGILLLAQSCTQDTDLSNPVTELEIQSPATGYESPEMLARMSSNRVAVAPVIDPINSGREVGTASLRRHSNGIFMNMYTSGLIPEHTYTVWWVVYNRPDKCTNAPCGGADNGNPEVQRELMYATGAVENANGRPFFRAYLRKGDTSGSINAELNLPEFGGLLDPAKAEVHLVLRSHGPAIPGLVEEQIGTFGGGCITSLPAFSEIPDEVGECANIQYAIFEPAL